MTSSLENLTNSFGGKLPILDNSNNWDIWNKQMKVIFGFQEVQEVIEAGITPIAANATEIENATSAKECWDILEKDHSGNDKLNQVRLTTWKRQFELLQMDENESIAEYFNKITNITNQMKSCGSTVSDGDMVEKVIGTLSSKFDYIIVAIMEAKDVSTMKLEELQCSLESHEQRINARAKNRTTDQALWPHTSKKGNGNKNKGKDQFKKENSQNKKVPRQYNNEESEANMAQDDNGAETYVVLMMAIIDDDYDEKGQWKWDTASTVSQSAIPLIFEEDNDGTDPPPVTAKIEPEVIHVAEHDEVHVEAPVEEHVEAHVEESVEEHVEAHVEGNVETHFRRSYRPTAPLRKLLYFDTIPDNLMTDDGDLVHLALFVDMEPLSYASATKSADSVQVDVKSAFLNGKLQEEVYVEQPQGFTVEGKEYYVLKVNKALYGLNKHQAKLLQD
ncbi:hypothetical protein TSUD_177090 [Trifolium subterraneum]|uniref:Reverse transcriptase Ty1/copia-type domain-containing protein n=1 Tax=Trifolium subterraneum TaxID=3900 RepID=A0A2Z6NTY6_TRISU|nr:hypothetical protein TSUD_177090 [Trifolium subterraneum]